ncbi:MAG: hypothetical protein ABJR05_12280 [Balneola sp.]
MKLKVFISYFLLQVVFVLAKSSFTYLEIDSVISLEVEYLNLILIVLLTLFLTFKTLDKSKLLSFWLFSFLGFLAPHVIHYIYWFFSEPYSVRESDWLVGLMWLGYLSALNFLSILISSLIVLLAKRYFFKPEI